MNTHFPFVLHLFLIQMILSVKRHIPLIFIFQQLTFLQPLPKTSLKKTFNLIKRYGSHSSSISTIPRYLDPPPPPTLQQHITTQPSIF